MKHLAIVGATGLVGRQFLNLMQKKNIIPEKLSLFASEKSKGKSIEYNNTPYPLQTLKPQCFKGIDIAFFSAGGAVSQEWGPQAVKDGAIVIDNSSTFRMQKDVPLVVPEINSHHIQPSTRLIANPNCSTIQMVIVLQPLHQAFGLESVQVATYQSASGAGASLVEQLKKDSLALLNGVSPPSGSLAFNCIPQIGEIRDDGFSLEDVKMQEETKKILELYDLSITAFTVRVPTLVSHGEVVWTHFKKAPQNRNQIIEALQQQRGLKVMPSVGEYPDNRTTTLQEDVFVGRIHQDPQHPQTCLMWVSADNLLKGAALNGLQIAQFLMDNPDKTS